MSAIVYVRLRGVSWRLEGVKRSRCDSYKRCSDWRSNKELVGRIERVTRGWWAVTGNAWAFTRGYKG